MPWSSTDRTAALVIDVPLMVALPLPLTSPVRPTAVGEDDLQALAHVGTGSFG